MFYLFLMTTPCLKENINQSAENELKYTKGNSFQNGNIDLYRPNWGLGWLQVGRTRDQFQAVILRIYSAAADISMRTGVDSTSKNEYQNIPAGKGGRCVRVRTLPPYMCRVSSNLEP